MDKKQGLVYSLNDDVMFHPEKYLPVRTEDDKSKYQIITGFGKAVIVDDDFHDQYTYFMKNQNEVNRFLKRIPIGLELLKIEDCFYAYIVEQNNQKTFFEQGIL
jgi:hypothetical protein